MTRTSFRSVAVAGIATQLLLGFAPSPSSPVPDEGSAAASRAVPQGQESPPDAVLPGGIEFAHRFLGMTGGSDEPFLARLASHLAEPGMGTGAEHLDSAIEELLEYRDRMQELRRRYGSKAPSLAQPNSYAYGKAEDLLDWLGVDVRNRDGRIDLEVDDGDDEDFRRRVFTALGYDVTASLPGWAAGDPIDIVVPMEPIEVPLGRTRWNRDVFEDNLGPVEFLRELLDDRAARDVLLAYSRLDPEARRFLDERVGIRDPADDDDFARGLAAVAPYLRTTNGELSLPGGSSAAWQEILGGWESHADLLDRLVTRDRGKPAHLWRALSLIPERRARYLLTLGHRHPDAVRSWADSLYGSLDTPAHGGRMRWRGDAAELFLALRLRPDGDGIDWPGGGRAWALAFRDDDVLDRSALRDELERLDEWPEYGREVDAFIIRRLVSGYVPAHEGRNAIERFLGVRSVLRYLPDATTPSTVTLLVRNYERFWPALGFLGVNSNLSEATVLRFVYQLQRADGLMGDQRDAAHRQMQSSLLILRPLLAGGVIPAEDQDILLQRLFVLMPNEDETGYGRSLRDWYREHLVPILWQRMAELRGAETIPEGRRTEEVLVAALAWRGRPIEVELDGVTFRIDPSATRRDSLDEAIAAQRLPRLGDVLDLDTSLATLVESGEEALRQRGPELRETLRVGFAPIEDSVPDSYWTGEADDAVPLPRDRQDLRKRVREAHQEAARDRLEPDELADVRRELTTALTDALVGLAYAIYIEDPNALYYRDRRLAWMHRLGPFTGREESSGPFVPTVEERDPERGAYFIDSLMGVPDWLGAWDLRLTTLHEEVALASAPVVEAWGALLWDARLANIHEDAQLEVVRRVARAREWLKAAAAGGEPALPAPWMTTGSHPAVRLDEELRLILGQQRSHAIAQAIREGEVVNSLFDGDLFLLGSAGVPDANTAAQHRIDLMVGMSAWRGPGDAGLTVPPRTPVGEASDFTADPWLYHRLLDLRLSLAQALEELGFPARLQARLLPLAAGAVLAQARPDTPAAWQEISTAIHTEVTVDRVREWVLEMAFSEEG